MNPAPLLTDNPLRVREHSSLALDVDYTPPPSPSPLPSRPRMLAIPTPSAHHNDPVDIDTVSEETVRLADVDILGHFPHMLQGLVAPKCPMMYSPAACTGTAIPKPLEEQKVKSQAIDITPLKKVVVHPHMIGPDLLNHINQRFSVNATRVDPSLGGPHTFFFAKFHPQFTKSGLPPVINSEKDVEQLEKNAHIDPTLHCLATAEAGRIVLKDDSDLYSVSSPGNKYPIPDILIYKGGVIRATVEVKTPNAFSRIVGFFSGGIYLKSPLFAMRYHHSTRSGKAAGGSRDKILQQIWDQMVAKGTNFGILTSYEHFLLCRRDQNTMFITPPIQNSNAPFLQLFAFLACATGLVDADKYLPTPQYGDAWWGQDVEDNVAQVVGIDPRTNAEDFLKSLKRKKELGKAASQPRITARTPGKKIADVPQSSPMVTRTRPLARNLPPRPATRSQTRARNIPSSAIQATPGPSSLGPGGPTTTIASSSGTNATTATGGVIPPPKGASGTSGSKRTTAQATSTTQLTTIDETTAATRITTTTTTTTATTLAAGAISRSNSGGAGPGRPTSSRATGLARVDSAGTTASGRPTTRTTATRGDTTAMPAASSSTAPARDDSGGTASARPAQTRTRNPPSATSRATTNPRPAAGPSRGGAAGSSKHRGKK